MLENVKVCCGSVRKVAWSEYLTVWIGSLSYIERPYGLDGLDSRRKLDFCSDDKPVRTLTGSCEYSINMAFNTLGTPTPSPSHSMSNLSIGGGTMYHQHLANGSTGSSMSSVIHTTMRRLENGMLLKRFYSKRKPEKRMFQVKLETRQLVWMRPGNTNSGRPEGCGKSAS